MWKNQGQCTTPSITHRLKICCKHCHHPGHILQLILKSMDEFIKKQQNTGNFCIVLSCLKTQQLYSSTLQLIHTPSKIPKYMPINGQIISPDSLLEKINKIDAHIYLQHNIEIKPKETKKTKLSLVK